VTRPSGPELGSWTNLYDAAVDSSTRDAYGLRPDPQAVVVRDERHLDDDDLQAVVDALAGQGVIAEPTHPRDIHPPEWVILLEWIDDQSPERDWEEILKAVAAATWNHFHHKGKMAPVRIDLHRHGVLVASSPLPPEHSEQRSAR
jgi:hypothetical protein